MTAAKVAQRTVTVGIIDEWDVQITGPDEGVEEVLHRWRSHTDLLAALKAALYPDDARGDEARAAIARAEGQS